MIYEKDSWQLAKDRECQCLQTFGWALVISRCYDINMYIYIYNHIYTHILYVYIYIYSNHDTQIHVNYKVLYQFRSNLWLFSIRWLEQWDMRGQEPSACPSFEAGTTTLFEHILERASLTEEEAADYLRQASWELRCWKISLKLFVHLHHPKEPVKILWRKLSEINTSGL